MKTYTVTFRRTVWQEVVLEDIEAESPDEAREIARKEVERAADNIERIADPVYIDSEHEITMCEEHNERIERLIAEKEGELDYAEKNRLTYLAGRIKEQIEILKKRLESES